GFLHPVSADRRAHRPVNDGNPVLKDFFEEMMLGLFHDYSMVLCSLGFGLESTFPTQGSIYYSDWSNVISPFAIQDYRPTTFYQHQSFYRMIGFSRTSLPAVCANSPEMSGFFQEDSVSSQVCGPSDKSRRHLDARVILFSLLRTKVHQIGILMS